MQDLRVAIARDAAIWFSELDRMLQHPERIDNVAWDDIVERTAYELAALAQAAGGGHWETTIAPDSASGIAPRVVVDAPTPT